MMTLVASIAMSLSHVLGSQLPSIEAPRCPDNDEDILRLEQDRNIFASASYRHRNTREDRVRTYTLPPLFKEGRGSRKAWEGERRQELLRLFEDHVYGRIPPAPDHLETRVLSLNEHALEDTAIRKEIRVLCRMDCGRQFDFDILLYVPKHVPRPPIWIGLNFNGNQYYTPEQDIRMTRGTIEGSGRWYATKPFTEQDRSRNLSAWNFQEAVRRGYAVATACYGEIFPDHVYGMEQSIYTLFKSQEEIRQYLHGGGAGMDQDRLRPFGAISAWAWGMSRILDVMEREPLVDASRAAVIGHSRLGKTALWAGANDLRFKLVVSNNSGCMGASLSRRNFGEDIYLLAIIRDYWFHERFLDYAGHGEDLPVDQHQLLALIAPRHLYVASSNQDFGADPKGEFLSLLAASHIWSLYGLNPGLPDRQPAADTAVGQALGYHVKTGKHSITAWDWKQYYRYADAIFCQEK